MKVQVIKASESHYTYVDEICELYKESAKVRGTGIATRKPGYIKGKMAEGKAVIALYDNEIAGICYIESWQEKKYVANSGLIVHPKHRKTGLAKKIKQAAFELSRELFPKAKLFGITTSLAVMKINSDLGYKPVTFSELTSDTAFWKGCQNCVNYDILTRTEQSMCLCTGMVNDLSKVQPITEAKKSSSWNTYKRFLKLRKIRIQRKFKKYPNLEKSFQHGK